MFELPKDLPIPIDDGGCDHLYGMQLPSVVMPSTNGEQVNVANVTGLVVIYCYPMTGQPNTPLPDGWDAIPGARGCTPQSCAFRNHYQELKQHGVSVYGLSTQNTEYQREAAERLHLPFDLLSDHQLAFCKALNLPTFIVDGVELVKRITVVVRDTRVVKVFYPVFPPDKNADEVIQWLAEYLK